jgi:hypothetical protein
VTNQARASDSGSFAIFATITCALLNSGCFEVTSNHVSKPIGPSRTVEFRHDPDSSEAPGWYVRHFHTPDLDFDIAVRNNAERFQTGFFLWVLPVPFSKTGIPDAEVEADLRPMESNIPVDPRRIEYIPTNGVAIAPARIWRRDGDSWQPVLPGPVFVSRRELFKLQYDAPCDPDLPFKISLGGIPVPDQTNRVTVIEYKRAKIVRPGFILPY